MALTVSAEYEPDAEFDLVHADSLRFFPQLVADLGGDPDALLRHVGIDPSLLSKRGSSLGYRAMANLLERAATELQCADFGMRLATVQGGGKVFGPMGVVMRNSNTLEEALDYVVKHVHAYSLAARMRFEPDRARRRVLVAFEILLDRLPDRRQAIEQALLLANLNVIETTGGRARVREVLFRHQPVSSPRTYRDCFGCEVRFDQKADGIVFTEQDLLCPIVDPDAQLYEMATSFIDTRFTRSMPPVHALVRGLMLQHLGGADCTNERIAAELCLHPRTLHRRLKAEGRSFQDIKDEVRRDVALYHLQHSDMPLVRIAEKLGYAESSVFSRSCLRWFGASPRQLRSRAQHSGHRATPSRLGGTSRAQQETPRRVAEPVAPAGGTAMLRGDALRKLTEVVTLLGGDADALLAKARIDPAILLGPLELVMRTSGDPRLYELVSDFIGRRYPMGEPTLETRVRAIVERLLIAGKCTHAGVAATLGMHPRTLQRRLRADGVSFETIKDDARREIALRYLKEPAIPLIRVAELLGYSSTSVLSRSCQRWFSSSPRQLRGGAFAARGGMIQ